MSQSTKPTTNVNTFVPEYWRESGGLDIGYANSHYLRFPVGQGTETFTNLLVSGTSTLGTTNASSITSSGNITAPNFVGNITLASTPVINRQVNFPTTSPNTSIAIPAGDIAQTNSVIYAGSKQTIDYPLNSTSTIRASNVIANLPVGSSAQYQNTFTFGKSIPPITLLGGEGTNTISVSTTNGQSWIGLGTSVFGTRGRCFVWNGTIWVAGGTNGVSTQSIAWSNDGLVWNLVSTGVISEVYNIVWDGIKFVAVGTPSPTFSIMYSYDGKNWFGASTAFSVAGLGIAYNGNIFVAGGLGATNTLATSPDGITWTGRGTATFPTECYDLAWNGALFVGVGANQLAYSYDGVSWVGLVSPLSTARVVEWNGLMFVAGGVGANQLAYSYDGLYWIDITINNLVGDIYGLGWNGSVWIVSGTGANRTAISYNGLKYIALGLAGIFSTNAYNASSNRMREHTITFPTNRTVIGGDGTNTIAYSDDEGATFTGLGNIIFTTTRALCSNGSVWVGGGSGLNTLAWSYDGITWNGMGTSIFSGNCYNIIWTGSLFWAVGQGSGNLIATSPNGSSWTGYGIPSPFITAIFDIAYNGSIYVACGAGGVIAYSTTGTSGWTAVSPALFNTDALAIEWNGSMFVAVGQGSVNTIAHSFDGINWTGQGRSIFTTAGRTVAWNGSVWVVGGLSGGTVVAYSKTGLSWTLGTGGNPLIRLNSVGWNGTRFIGLGQGGLTASSSPDGVNWTSYTPTNIFTTAGHTFGSNINQSSVSIKQNILILGRTGTNDVMYYSLDDGVNWTAMKTTMMTTNCAGLIWNGYVWIAGGLGTNSLSYSYNGQNWVGISGVLNDNGRGIGWNGNRLVAVGSNSTTNNVAYSNNGVNWTALNVNAVNMGWRCVAGNSSGTWVIGGQGTNSMAYSIDNGLTWTTLVGGGALPTWAMGILWTGTKFIVVALGGSMVYTSTNGSTWSAITNISGFTFGVCVATNGNIVVAGGVGSSTLAYSRDQGATWTAVINSGSVFQAITSITWTGTRFVACGNRISGGTGIYSSIDGITWSAPTATTFTNTDAVISSGIGITQDNSFQIKYPDTQLDVVAPNYFNQGYSNCSISISQS